MNCHCCLARRYNGVVQVSIRPFHLRDFEPSDFDTLWRIDQDCFPPGISYSRGELRAYMRRPGSFTLVAVNSEAAASYSEPPEPTADSISAQSHAPIAGFIVAESHNGKGHIVTIDVIAAARRHGVGSLLLQGAEERLRTGGCRSVQLETAVDNTSALTFYKRHDYSVIRTFPRYYSNGVDALVLQKSLLTA
jgi:[ribosomal protein S18]-alanine N-acetyltransferase